MHCKYMLGFIFVLFAADSGVAADMAAGKKTFEQICSFCHKVDYDEKVGPGLAGITERRNVEWLDKFLLNPAEMIKTDEYARTLKENNRYGLTMPSLPEMKRAENRRNVIEYLKTL